MPSIVKEARSRGITLTREVLSILSKRDDWKEVLDFGKKIGISGLLTENKLEEILKEMDVEKPESTQVVVINKDAPAKSEDSDIKIIRNLEKSQVHPSIKGMRNYFMSRYSRMKKVLEKKGFKRYVSFEVAKKRAMASKDAKVRIIGMVNSISITSKNTKIVTLEDPEGEMIKVIIRPPSATIRNGNIDYERMMMAEEAYRANILQDMVIGVEGTARISQERDGSRTTIIFPDRVILPDIGLKGREDFFSKKNTGLWMAFISDIHIGSSTFMAREWNRFIDFLNGRGITSSIEERILKGLKYIVVTGDLVDGIGVFPGQEFELSIMSIYDQYEALAREFEKVPDHIEIIIMPGNHDAVRPSEPQPPLPNKFFKYFPDNTHNFSNPSLFSLHGRDILGYHGRGFDDLALKVQGMKYDNPIEMMKVMLALGHLVPIYGEKTPIAPEPDDHLVIDYVPHIFVTGHVHKHSIDFVGHRKSRLMLLNASTWQDQTEYQKSMSFVPDPCKVTFVSVDDLNQRYVRSFAG